MRLLITGAGGMLGQDVSAAAREAGHEVLGYDHAELDVTDPAAVDALLRGARPDAVVNCAAWTDVDGAQSAEEQALAVNGAGAGHVARAADAAGAWTIHISSDYVFDGSKAEPLRRVGSGRAAVGVRPLEARRRARGGSGGTRAPHDRPLLVAVRDRRPLLSRRRSLRLAGERDELTVVDDQIGCPTFTGHLAAALVGLAASGPAPGILHVAGGGQCSWYEFALAIVAAARGPVRGASRARTAELGRPAPPTRVQRAAQRAAARRSCPTWREGLTEYMMFMSRERAGSR